LVPLLFKKLVVPIGTESLQQRSQEKAWRAEATGERFLLFPFASSRRCVITFLLFPSPLCSLGSPLVQFFFVIAGIGDARPTQPVPFSGYASA
jgi:hypothetical protein